MSKKKENKRGSTGRRLPAEARREQIVGAAMELLATTPLEGISTRKIANLLEISQPALFRHFQSREQLLLAVIAHSRAELAAAATRVLQEQTGAAEQLRAALSALLEHVAGNPGLTRLLFSLPTAGALSLPLRQLMSMQIAFVTELVREGQREGVFSAALEPQRSARLLVAMLQGVILQWQVGDRAGALVDEAPAIYELWLGGAADPLPPEAARPAAERVMAPERGAKARVKPEAIQELDARPIIARGDDPLEEILAAIDELGAGGVLKLVAPFRPAPLIALLSSRGHAVSEREVGARCWAVEVIVDGWPVADLRELEAPEPLEQVLRAASALKPGEVYLARLPRFPRLLLGHLAQRSVSWQIYEEPDGTALIRLYGKAS